MRHLHDLHYGNNGGGFMLISKADCWLYSNILSFCNTFFSCLFFFLFFSYNAEILSEESFQEVLRDSVEGSNADAWSPVWVLRYSVIVKTRGIIKSKGYIVQAKRKAPH